ncbi:hypothetical protein R3W88_019569 [Solanum pinnatisectum]|uniref:Uncharacterized protein n=1 Tax=Solanum pinnatisectum TaxID=50273 RepID=A0AAV9KJW0_9SOLN|nr:hypothetical protein R3W88_019569 [Solanum pinnatisectum]
MLQEFIAKLFARLDGDPTFGICSVTTCSTITIGATPPVQEPSVGFYTPCSSSEPSFAPLRFAVPYVSVSVTGRSTPPIL